MGQPLGPQPPGPSMERVNLVDGRHFEGLVESDGDDWLYFIQIQRPPGQAMHLVVRMLDRGSVVSIAHLAGAGAGEPAGADPAVHQPRGIEAGRMDAVTLTRLDTEGNHYQHYAGKWFTLDSTADEPTTRRVIVRVEQIFAAYRQMFQRCQPPQPPRLVVLNSIEQYQAFRRRGACGSSNRAASCKARTWWLWGASWPGWPSARPWSPPGPTRSAAS